LPFVPVAVPLLAAAGGAAVLDGADEDGAAGGVDGAGAEACAGCEGGGGGAAGAGGGLGGAGASISAENGVAGASPGPGGGGGGEVEPTLDGGCGAGDATADTSDLDFGTGALIGLQSPGQPRVMQKSRASSGLQKG